MFDEKNPRQESVKVNSSKDEAIIDLTNEVIAKTEIDNDTLESSNAMVDGVSQADKDEEIPAQDESDNLELQEKKSVIDLNDQTAGDQVQFGDDQLIASAMENTLRADKDDPAEMTQQFDLNSLENTLEADKDDAMEMTQAFDLNSLKNTLRADNDDPEEMTQQFDLNSFDEEDILIVDNTQDEADQNINAMAGSEAAGSHRDEDVFDLEEEIDLDYELDDDEDEIIELDDERSEDNQDFVDLMLGASKESDQSDDDDDDDDEQTVYLEFKTEEPGDIIVPDAERDHATEAIAPAQDEASEFDDSDDLPELETVSELDFEDEEDSLAIDEQETDSGDDIIARTVEQSLSSDDDRENVDLADEADFGMEYDDAVMAVGGSQGDDEEILAPAEEEPRKIGNDNDLLDLNAGSYLKDDAEILPRDGFNDLKAEDEEDIIEITEFDQHYPADDEELLKQPGMLDASGTDEEDFLELIDIKEDSLSDNKKLKEFNDSPAETGKFQIKQLFGDDFEGDKPGSISSDDPEDLSLVNKFTGSIFYDSAQRKSGLDDELPGAAEKAPEVNLDSTTDAGTPISKDEKYDSDFDPNSITQKIDRADTFFPEDGADEPEAASLPVDRAATEEKEAGLEESLIVQGMDELPAVPAGQIDAAIERIISEKFSGTIENIIYEVIEKAVAKEIDRLKRTLMGSNTTHDYED